MTDRVHPSAKAPAANGGNLPLPAAKAHIYNPARPTYRPRRPPPRRGRSCAGACCFWIILVVLLLLLLIAVGGAVFWFLYRPHRPTFSVSSLQVSRVKPASPTGPATKFDLTVDAHNPNKKLEFLYDPISISLMADGVDAGEGSLPAFEHAAENTTRLRTNIMGSVKSDPKSKTNLSLKIQMESKVKVNVGGFKTKKVTIRVICDSITAAAPTGKKAMTATVSGSKCEVDLRVKIWKWTF
ncbi:hypothetical protein NMG60_11004126 [Bertholletia excelsa]